MADTAAVLAFAHGELRRCLKRMDETVEVTPELYVDPAAFPAVADPKLDDAYSVDWHGCAGRIIGSNPRSVLLGVYALLKEAGCRFIRPGKAGEIIPLRAVAELQIAFTRVADHRYRGYCIEGAVSEEHVRDIIDWLPKMGFNLYFIQFREAHVFFEEWYTHQFNEFLPTMDYTVEQSREIVRRLGVELRKRGLSYHACGHGWLCESIGYSSTGWHQAKNEEIPETIRPLLAEVNGVRQFFGDIPVNTQLCYSSPEVQRRVVREIVTYAAEHPEKDVLHIWLADNFNNTCECETCRRLNPSDYYVQMLNEVDRQLTEIGSPMKIAFILYYDLLWPPVREQLNNASRFILLFAPITRTYREPYFPKGHPVPDVDYRMRVGEKDIAPYRRNHMLLPKGAAENLHYLYLWQQRFAGDCIIFDYHMMWDIHKNYSQLSLSKVQFQDVEFLYSLGLNGYISCQLTRSGFPSGLCNYLLGEKLFDRSLSYETASQEYFSAAFGERWETAHSFLQLIDEGFSWAYSRGELPVVDNAVAVLLKQTPQKLYNFRAMLREGEEAAAFPEQRQMWRFLQEAVEVYGMLALILYNKASGQPLEAIRQQFELFRQMLCQKEVYLQDVFDLCSFILIVSTIIEKTDAEDIAFDKKA